MPDLSLGIVLVLITLFGAFSNYLNWRYLNNGIIRLLYYVGAFVHEMSHAVVCLLTGAKIKQIAIFCEQPQVVHQKSKIPFLGELLISAAPIAGGLLFLFLMNRYVLGNYFVLPAIANVNDWRSILMEPLAIVSQINLLQWQSWVMILLFFNVGAMIGPSLRDLRNVWPALIVLFFVQSSLLAGIGLMALGLIFVNIILQVLVIVPSEIGSLAMRERVS